MFQTYLVRIVYQYRLFAQDKFENNGNQSYNELIYCVKIQVLGKSQINTRWLGGLYMEWDM
jgi:hypothetical protein